MRKIFIISAILLIWADLPARSTGPEPPLEIRSLSEVTGLKAGAPVYTFTGGGDFSDPEYHDGQWQRTGFPSSWTLKDSEERVRWYRMPLKFPEESASRAVGIRLGRIMAADRVWFNGTLIGSTGTDDPAGEPVYDKKRLYQIPSALIRPGEINILAVKNIGLFPEGNGPYTGEFSLGPLELLQQNLLFEEVRELLLISAYLAFSVFFFTFYLSRREERGYLLYSLFSLSLCLYFLLRTQMKFYLSVDLLLLKKTEYLLLGAVLLFMMEYFMVYFRAARRVPHYLYYGASAVYCGLIIFTNDCVFWSQVLQNFLQPAWIVPLATVVYLLSRNIKRERDAGLMLAAFAVLFGCFVNDVLADRAVIESPRLSQYGFLLMTGSLGIILNRRFVGLHSRVEDLNRNLEKRVAERTSELNEKNSELTRNNEYISKINKRNSMDLMLASRIQSGLIPEDSSEGLYEISSYYRPASSVSGDLFDVYHFEGGALGAVLIDVSGHGLGSALITMMAKPVFYQTCRRSRELSLRQAVKRSNELITEAIGGIDNYMTGIFIRIQDSILTFVNAGHPPGLLYSERRGAAAELKATGIFLGIEGVDEDFRSRKVKLERGDILVLYTDALIESRNPEGEEFGFERAKGIVCRGGWSAADLKAELVRSLFEHTGTEELKDDCTLLVIKIKEAA